MLGWVAAAVGDDGGGGDGEKACRTHSAKERNTKRIIKVSIL